MQNPSRNPFSSDLVFDWKSEDPDFKSLIRISQFKAPNEKTKENSLESISRSAETEDGIIP